MSNTTSWLGGLLVITLALPGCSPGSEHAEGAGRTASKEVMSVAADDAEMTKAIKQAQQTMTVFLRVLASPQPSQRDFSVKRPYPTEDGSGAEHIWISDVSFDGALLHGKVSDIPLNIANLTLFDAVSFPPSEISDWMFLQDGKVVGGYTIRVLRSRMSPEEAAEFDAEVRFAQ